MEKLGSMPKLLFFFIKNYRIHLIGIFFLSLGYAILESINVAAIFPVVNSVLTGSDTTSKSYGKIIHTIYKLLTILPFNDIFISACVFLIVATILKSIFFLLYTILSNKLMQTARRNLQGHIFTKMIHSDYQYFLDHQQGVLIYRVLNAPINVSSILKSIPDIFIQFCKIIFLLILLLTISVKTSLGIIAIGTFFGVLVKMISGSSYRFGKKILQAITEETTVTNESISGIGQIKIYMNEEMWINKFKEKLNHFYYYKLRAIILSITPHIVLEPLVMFLIGITGIVLKLTYEGNFLEMLPALMVYAYAIIRITPSLAVLGATRINLMTMLPDVENCYSSLNTNTRSICDGNQLLKPLYSGVTFQNVSFAYPNRNEVFNGLTLTINKGQSTAIVGPSGVGKSTLINLLVRLYDPKEGVIRVDGVDLRNIQICSWRDQIGYVSQDPFIFHATISENIVFGQGEYQMSDIIDSAKTANAHNFIAEFPDGYDTIVGDRGMKLSGGQKQRIAIARAIIRRPQLIIFDEATSALDNISESLMQESINKISKNYTVIIVAHRLSTIQKVDKIIVLDNKKIAEEGTHSELLNLKGVYWKLYNQPFDGEAKNNHSHKCY